MARTDKGTTTRGLRSRADFVCDTAGGQLAVRIRGEIDHHTAVEVRQGIDTLLYERRPRRLVLDLSAVSFMDSSGLGLIMGRLSVMREFGGELVVWNPSREVLRIVTLAGMERLVRIEYPPDRAYDHAVDAPENRRNEENHRDDNRAATAENRGITAVRQAPNGTETPSQPPKTRKPRSSARTSPRPLPSPRVITVDEPHRRQARTPQRAGAPQPSTRRGVSATASRSANSTSMAHHEDPAAGQDIQRKETDV